MVAFTLAACSEARMTNEFHEIGRFHAPDMHTLYPGVAHFVVTPESVLTNRDAALAFSRGLCRDDDQLCFVFFWTDASKAAAGFPMTDRQSAAMAASYRRNRSTGADGFQCYNFGTSAERCVAR